MVMYVRLTQWTDIMQSVALQCFKVGIAQCTSKSHLFDYLLLREMVIEFTEYVVCLQKSGFSVVNSHSG